jgi:2-methylcitrate dehydratase PrpD
VFGAAAAAGKLIGLDAKPMAYAIGLAGLASAGYRQPFVEGQMAKPVQVGYAAERGIAAALLAGRGVEAPLQIFEGAAGLFAIFSDAPKEQIVEACLAGLGERHLVHDTYTKLYPCCRYTHPAIEAAFALRRYIPDPDRIRDITVATFDIAIEATAPNQHPSTPQAARFSMNYLLAVALHQGSVGMEDFTEAAIQRAQIQDTARKVTAYSAKEWNAVYPGVRGAEVVITTTEGARYAQKIDRLSGMTGDHAEVSRKFLNVCQTVYRAKALQRIIDFVASLDSAPDAAPLVALCENRRDVAAAP